MFFKKSGYPEESDLVICTVKKVLPHATFVDLDEYKDKEGYIHISEIAPGRIRNIRDYVIEGRKVICKVLKIDKEKGHIDLSLRRVSLSMRKTKDAEYKQEQKSEKILEQLAKLLRKNLEQIYAEIGEKILNKYGLLNLGFQEISKKSEEAIKDLNITKKDSEALVKLVKEKVKPPEVQVSAEIFLTSFASNGINDIKKALYKGLSFKEDNINVNINYLGAPRYKLNVKAPDYKTANKVLEQVSYLIFSEIKKTGQGKILKQEKEIFKYA